MKKVILIFLTLVMSLCALTSCGENEEKAEGDKAQTTSDAQATTEKIEFYKSDVETFEIETPYAKLKYPVKWKDECVVETTEGDPYIVAVSAKSGDESIKVFDIAFGAAPKNGNLLGTMNSDGKEVTVSIVDYSEAFADKYSAEESSRLYAMAEDVNEIISGLVYEYNLTLE